VLRRAENVRIEFRYGLGFSTTGRVRLHVGTHVVTLGYMRQKHLRELLSRALQSGLRRSAREPTGTFRTASIGRTMASPPTRFMPCSSQSSSESAARRVWVGGARIGDRAESGRPAPGFNVRHNGSRQRLGLGRFPRGLRSSRRVGRTWKLGTAGRLDSEAGPRALDHGAVPSGWRRLTGGC
jgi:hypothetical protein